MLTRSRRIRFTPCFSLFVWFMIPVIISNFIRSDELTNKFTLYFRKCSNYSNIWGLTEYRNCDCQSSIGRLLPQPQCSTTSVSTELADISLRSDTKRCQSSQSVQKRTVKELLIFIHRRLSPRSKANFRTTVSFNRTEVYAVDIAEKLERLMHLVPSKFALFLESQVEIKSCSSLANNTKCIQ